MEKKFACLEYVKTLEEIPIKYNIIKKCPPKVMDWYVKKFNPFKIEDIQIGNISGYKIKMPFIESDLENDMPKVNFITDKTLGILENYNIEIITLPKKYKTVIKNNMYEANGKYLMPFFLVESITRTLKIVGKKIKNAEVLIIDGNSELTKIIIDNIYLDVNYLSVLVNEKNELYYEDKVFEVFDDSGLNLQITKNAKSQLKSADIVINTSNDNNKYDFYFKRGAIYFNLAKNDSNYYEFTIKRQDVLTIDNFKISCNDEPITLEKFELSFFIKCLAYKNLIYKGYKTNTYNDIKNDIKKMDLSLLSFYNNDKLLNSSYFTKFLIKAGVK